MKARKPRLMSILNLIFIGVTCLAQSQTVLAQLESTKSYNPTQVKQAWMQTGFEFEEGWQPLIDAAEARAWGIAAEQAAADQNPALLAKMIEFQPVIDRCVSGISSEEFVKGFGIGAKQGTSQLLTTLSNEQASYKFLGTRDTEFGPGVMMRMIDPNGGCNYHLWRFMKNDAGELKGIDIYVFLSGETFGETMRRMALLAAPKDDRSFLEKLTGKESAMAEHQMEMVGLIQNVQTGKYTDALESYDSLPAVLQKEKPLMMMRILASIQVDEDAYLQALKDYQLEFPDDASADLVSIDLHFLKKDYEEMHATLSRLEKAIGEDAHLKMLHSVGYNGEGKTAEALKALQEAIELEPESERLYWSLVESGLTSKNHDVVLSTLKTLCNKFGYREFDFSTEPIYAGFVKSPQHDQFQEFLKTLK